MHDDVNDWPTECPSWARKGARVNYHSVIGGLRYRHYKGAVYRVIGVAEHTESGERLVIYRSVSEDARTWARPVTDFVAVVRDPNGRKVRRFDLIREE